MDLAVRDSRDTAGIQPRYNEICGDMTGYSGICRDIPGYGEIQLDIVKEPSRAEVAKRVTRPWFRRARAQQARIARLSPPTPWAALPTNPGDIGQRLKECWENRLGSATGCLPLAPRLCGLRVLRLTPHTGSSTLTLHERRRRPCCSTPVGEASA